MTKHQVLTFADGPLGILSQTFGEDYGPKVLACHIIQWTNARKGPPSKVDQTN